MRVTISERSLKKLCNKSYRESFSETELRMSIAHQIRALRIQRGWSQQELADRAKMKQSAISRLEDPDYPAISLGTLVKIARAFDVALSTRFVSFAEAIFRSKNVSDESFHVESFSASEFSLSSPLVAHIETLNVRTQSYQPSLIVSRGAAETRSVEQV